MCGLVGIFGRDITNADSALFSYLLRYDIHRGKHSTGVAIGSEDYISIYKSRGLPEELYSKFPPFRPGGEIDPYFIQDNKPKFLMGHNRHATKGGVNTANAHPFNLFPVIGCHNGTLNSGVTTGVEEGFTSETDSERLLKRISEEDTLAEALEGVTGAAALSYYDNRDNTYNLYRNSERPLYFALSKDRQKVVYASEEWMIEVALQVTKRDTSFNETFECEVNTHYSFALDGNYAISVKEEEAKLKKHQWGGTNGSMGYRNTRYNEHFASVRPAKVVDLKPASKTLLGEDYRPGFFLASPDGSGEVSKDPEDSCGWHNMENFSTEYLVRELAGGCSFCQGNIDLEDHKIGDVLWLDQETPMCKGCATQWYN